MASDVTDEQAQPAPPPGSPTRERTSPRRPYRARFALVYALLAAIIGASIAASVVLLRRDSRTASPGGAGWSAWKPTSSANDARAKEIAQRIARSYKLPSGAQLLDVVAGPPTVQDVPIRAVAVRAQNGASSFAQITDDDSLMFILCGLGQKCAIATGKPSLARGRLVRREALELALYAFKYVKSVNYVVAFMPPRKRGADPELVIYFHRDDLAPRLERPLAATLSPKTPLQNTIPPRETKTIDQLTEPHVFRFQLQQAPQGDAILVLQQPPA